MFGDYFSKRLLFSFCFLFGNQAINPGVYTKPSLFRKKNKKTMIRRIDNRRNKTSLFGEQWKKQSFIVWRTMKETKLHCLENNERNKASLFGEQ